MKEKTIRKALSVSFCVALAVIIVFILLLIGDLTVFKKSYEEEMTAYFQGSAWKPSKLWDKISYYFVYIGGFPLFASSVVGNIFLSKLPKASRKTAKNTGLRIFFIINLALSLWWCTVSILLANANY